ncbi:pimeloyl-ACP methyl ester carboxylesterase [Neorhizobium huautlense]|uniref:Pimeloyl-ACP methyl ester carboxylesterase n=1 Tax=Neorhizobium huautlense TaxID=67774 RepID=A0ABT9PYH5_9HYPH|nr:alpha/beta hydrolase [Neorhizobium huautlense]MDP9839543.1 pimeloyl-ACP methyl ester carboxylesterase [Neorhizobium huautlense]
MTLLMIPGFMLDADLWRDVEPALAPWGPVTHAVATEGDTLAEMAQSILKNAPPTFTLVGFSMGGYVAREILRQAPDRVEALILIATSARGDSEIQVKRKQALAGQPDGITFKGLSSVAVASSLHPDNAGRTDLIMRIQEMGQRFGGTVFRRQSLLDRRDERGELGTITCPTLVIAGDEDRLRSREEALELHEGIAGSAFAVIEKTGHMVPMEAPEKLAEVMSGWLARRQNGPITT